jgi:tetratricopeptide (TPR) repeat protein
MPALEPGQRLSHYVVVEKIGAGGMGEVYRARDDRLDRDVALKILPPEVAGDPRRRQRFETEARALARLSHTNLLEIHDVGETDGVAFAVTELLDGESLRSVLRRGKPALTKSVEIAAAIADGLAAAHAAGIVHRDLKPENVFVTRDGRVKILDFGLARVDEIPSEDSATRAFPEGGTDPGQVLGTAGYMAPEQVRGESADARSDIFALGCILYEVLSGRRAFARETPAESMTAILREDPQNLTSLNADVSPDLERIVLHCLEKRPDERFQSARDLAFDLRSSSEGSESRRSTPLKEGRGWRRALSLAGVVAVVIVAAVYLNGIKEGPDPVEIGLDRDRIAVAVFENRTGDPDLEVLGKMAADWLTHGLAETGAVDVVPGMSSLMSIGGGESDEDPLLRFAQDTGAGVIVSGAYYVRGETLTFHARVTSVVEGELIHAFRPIGGPLGDPMESLEELNQRVMGLMASRDIPGMEHRGMSRPPRFEAYSEYVAGLELFGRDNARSFRHFQRAAELDPDQAAPRLFLAHYYHEGRQDDLERATLAELLERREQLSPFEQRWLDVFIARSDRKHGELLRLLGFVLDQAPRDLGANHWVGLSGTHLNRPRLTVETYAAMDPDRVREHYTGRYWNIVLARAYHLLGDYDAALGAARRGVDWYSDDLWNHASAVAAMAALGRIEQIPAMLDEVVAIKPISDFHAGKVMLLAVEELHVHGHNQAAAETADLAVEWSQRRANEPNAALEDRLHLAMALYRADRLDEARAVLVPLLAEDAGNMEGLGLLGCVAARAGDETEALERSADLAAIDRPKPWGHNTYRRARIAALLGESDDAVDLLRQAVGEGYQHWYEIHHDPDLASLRGYPPFDEFVRPRE